MAVMLTNGRESLREVVITLVRRENAVTFGGGSVDGFAAYVRDVNPEGAVPQSEVGDPLTVEKHFVLLGASIASLI
ncbi:hypothetical protein CCP3SC15_730012 [Gammaproteobacteria bacterium]